MTINGRPKSRTLRWPSQAMQRGLVDHCATYDGCAVALVGEAQPVKPAGLSAVKVHASDHRPHRHQRMCTDTGAHFWRKCTTTVRLRTRQTQAASSPGAEPAMGATRATSAKGTHPIDRIDRVGRTAALTLTGHRPARAAS